MSRYNKTRLYLCIINLGGTTDFRPMFFNIGLFVVLVIWSALATAGHVPTFDYFLLLCENIIVKIIKKSVPNSQYKHFIKFGRDNCEFR